MATPANDPRSLQELASDISLDLGKLATGLAHAGADPNATKGLQRMAVMVGDVAKTLGAGPVGAQGQHPGAEAQPAPGGPPEAAGAPPQGGPPAGPGGPSVPGAAPAPPQGVRPGERPNGFHEAAANLQAALASKHAAAQRALAGNQ
jgi:hypothetical protein